MRLPWCAQRWQSRFSPRFLICVFTYNRIPSLKRLLASLRTAVYSPLVSVGLRVFVDHSPGTRAEMTQVLTQFEWTHGPYDVQYARQHKVTHAGLSVSVWECVCE